MVVNRWAPRSRDQQSIPDAIEAHHRRTAATVSSLGSRAKGPEPEAEKFNLPLGPGGQVKANRCQTIEELSNALNQPLSTIQEHLQQIAKTSRAGVWVPHNLYEDN
ncbi:hypothetical protein TNCV_3593731 [Trichonephila clavipes]|nr:hypothetical protein TNCV_3593731 [Trichonephila clavipes]